MKQCTQPQASISIVGEKRSELSVRKNAAKKLICTIVRVCSGILQTTADAYWAADVDTNVKLALDSILGHTFTKQYKQIRQDMNK